MVKRRGTWCGFLLVLAFVATACGDGSDETELGADDGGGGDEATVNACPADGCMIGFADIATSGDEIEVTWEINFDPDIANNHIHIYWDSYTAAQVSDDASDRGVEQGEWVPTDSAPTYVTDGAVSTAPDVRGDSTTLCLVAADRDHNVIDEATQVCEDVSEFLS